MRAVGSIGRFFILSTSDTFKQKTLCCEHCPRHCRMFSSIPGLYPLDASNSPPVVTTTSVCRHCQMSLSGAKLLRIAGL